MSFTQQETQCGCSVKHDDLIQFLTDIVDQVISFKEGYFETHSVEDAINKDKDTQDLIVQNLEVFKKHELPALDCNKAYYNYLKGKLLNVNATYSDEAEGLLSKAIKLDPKLVNAWIELGECYCKNGEREKAKSCFEGALKEEKNRVALRNLSIILRQEVKKTTTEMQKNVTQSLSFAKEAVQLDAKDGVSWEILGNAFLTYFFMVHQHPNVLKQSLNAYTHAEKFVVTKTSPDLHYNKAINFRYQEEFELALESFHKSSLYAPTWEFPIIKENQLLKYLGDIQDLVINKGKLKPKKLQQILKSINSNQLGPYGNGQYTSTGGQTVKLNEIGYESLKEGLNEEKVILGKVICSVRNEDSVPFTFCSIDKAGFVLVTTVFNIAEGKGVIIGDSVAIPEPFVTDVNFSYKDKVFQFRLVRVETPVIMVVNSRKLGKNVQAGVQISISSKFD